MDKSKSQYLIRPYKEGDETHIISLFKEVFGKEMGKTESLQHWQWEFQHNPASPISIMLGWHKQSLVAQYAVNPVAFWSQGEVFNAALSLDTMTDKNYSGQGLFQDTARLLYNDILKKGLSFVYGFPNSQSIHGFLKYLGWQEILAPPIFICPLDLGPIFKDKLKSESLGKMVSKISKPVLGVINSFFSDKDNIRIRKEKSFNIWADKLWQKCRNQHKLWIVRDYKYLSWRYDIRPESQYTILTAWDKDEIIGYIITTTQLRAEGRICFILDVLSDISINGVTEALINSVVKLCINNNDAMISALLMPASIYRPIFHKYLFFPLPQRLFPQEINFGGRLLNKNISPNIFYNPASWHISWGDTDLL